MAGQGSGGNVLAAIGSFLIPGLGQLVQGRLMAAFFFFIMTTVCYAPGCHRHSIYYVGTRGHFSSVVDYQRRSLHAL